MPCDQIFLPGQSLKDRILEVTKVKDVVEQGLASGKIKAVVDQKTGGVAFQGLSATDRSRVTDNCIYRRIMAKGTAISRMKIAQAEKLAGRSVSKQAVAQGVHSHDGGKNWHDHKG